MIEAKKDSVTLFVEATSKVGQVVVCIDFEAKCSFRTLRNLVGGCCCMCCGAADGKSGSGACFPEQSEQSIVCYSLFKVVERKLAGSPLEVSKSKVGDVSCGYNGERFFISWQVQGTISATRKSLGLALACLNPSKVYSIYQDYSRAMMHVPNREQFNYAADEIGKSIRRGVICGVVGKIKVDATKVKDMVEVVAKKLPDIVVDGAKVKPGGHAACNNGVCNIRCTGWQAALLKEYVMSVQRGISLDITSNGICVNAKEARWDAVARKLKSMAKDYVAMKYGNVKADLHQIIAYLVLSSSSAGASHMHSFLKSQPSVAAIGEAIVKCL